MFVGLVVFVSLNDGDVQVCLHVALLNKRLPCIELFGLSTLFLAACCWGEEAKSLPIARVPPSCAKFGARPLPLPSPFLVNKVSAC